MYHEATMKIKRVLSKHYGANYTVISTIIGTFGQGRNEKWPNLIRHKSDKK